jgi:AcrR family transcriptional regulator
MSRRPDIAHRAELAARAFDVIRERGVHRTSMSDLATALEVKRPTLYWYFKDLGEIFEAVFEDTQRRYFGFVATRLAGVEHPLDYLETLGRATLEFHQGRREIIVILFQLWAVGGTADPQRALARGRAGIEPLRAGLIARLDEGVRRGVVAPCDPTLIIDLAIAVFDGAIVQWITRDEPAERVLAEFHRRVLEPLRIAAPATAARRPSRAARPRRKR